MSVKTRITELNSRLAEKLTAKGVSANGAETTTVLINKIEDIDTRGINPNWWNWSYFDYGGCRDDMAKKLKYSDTSKAGVFVGMFQEAVNFTEIPRIDTHNGQSFQFMFQNSQPKSTKLVTIPILNFTKAVSVASAFTNCVNLENLTLEGTLSISGLDLHWSGKLSKTSVISVINALSETAADKAVTFSKTAVNTAFETSAGAEDGAESEEWLNLISQKSNWTITLS